MPARPAAALRPDHHQELVELLEVRDRLLEDWRETTRLHREEVRSLEARIIRVRDILAGRDHHQEQLPGTQAVALKPAKGKKAAGSGHAKIASKSGPIVWTVQRNEDGEEETVGVHKKDGRRFVVFMAEDGWVWNWLGGDLVDATDNDTTFPTEALALLSAEEWARQNPVDEVEAPKKPEAKVSKKFPQGGDLTERCTQCGKERGEHAGSKCPPEDDEPPRKFPVEDELAGETYEADTRGEQPLLTFSAMVAGTATANLLKPSEVYTIEKLPGGSFRWMIIGKKYSTPFKSFVACRNAAERDAAERVASLTQLVPNPKAKKGARS